MNRQLLQPLTACVQSLVQALPQRLTRFGLAIVLSGLLLNAVFILPSSAMAQPTAVATETQTIAGKTIVGIHNFFVNQPIASATAQMSAIVVNRLRQDLSKRTKIPTAKLKLVEAKPTTWNDGCFGLPKADEICTQALVQGWRVVFSDSSQRWTYRTDKQGRSYRLES